MTVKGPVPPGDLGVTLVHEHLLLDGSCWLEPGDDAEAQARAEQPVTVGSAPLIREALTSNRDNLILSDRDTAVAELCEFARLGGGALVDVTSGGLGPDPSGLKTIAEASGTHVVMGSGFYCEVAVPARFRDMSSDQLAELIEASVTAGVAGVRAGIIGEVGVNGQEHGTGRLVSEMTLFEERSLRAAARASLRTGAAVTVHLPDRRSAVYAVMQVVDDEGLDPSRVVLGHMSWVPDFDTHVEALRRGYWIAYDDFGMDDPRWYKGIDDERRTDWVLDVFDRGHGDQLLVSQDVACKVTLSRFGGTGYGHILRSVVPVLLERGLSQAEVDRLLVTNPAAMLAF